MSVRRSKRVIWELWVLCCFGALVTVVTLASMLVALFHWPRWLWEPWFDQYILPQQSNYILSAIAQVLGALFALVFSMTLIAVQFVTKYTHRTMKIIFNRKMLIYMAGFASSIILPLLFLISPTKIGTTLSMVTGWAVVASLILLFLDLKKRMNIRWAIEIIKKEAITYFARKDFKETDVEENINALDSIAMGAYADKNYEVFGMATNALTELALGIESKYEKLEYDSAEERLHKSIFYRLHATVMEVINNPAAIIVLIKQLGDVGVGAIKEKTEKSCYILLDEIMFVEDKSHEKPIIELSAACEEALHQISIAAIKEPIEQKLNYCYLQSIHYSFQIYEYHMSKEWLLFLQKFLKNIIDLITIQLCNKKTTPLSMASIGCLLKFGEFFLKKGLPFFRYYTDELYRLIIQLRDNKGITLNLTWLKSLSDKIDTLGRKCLMEKNMEHEAESLFSRLADISELAWKAGYINLFKQTQLKYSSAIKVLPKVEVFNLLRTLMKQTQKLLKFKSDKLDSVWSIEIVATCIAAFKDSTGKEIVCNVNGEIMNSKRLWNESKPVLEKLRGFASLRQWKDVIRKLEELFEYGKVIDKFEDNPFSFLESL